MNITIDKAEQLPEQIKELAKQAQQEGFQFVDRLIEEYDSGKNRFNLPGEFLLFVYDGDKLIACGGLNQQWNENEIDSRIGRVRRFYVLPKYRKHGVGKQLLQQLEKEARANFSALCLNTDTKNAAHFYQKQNYVFVENHPNYSYFKYLI
ncbi:GNAT family N-acetyltransferase [Acinetobacter sp. ANC 4169]|uniref:GNAT family N-acetyltransferase n=1 Tax=Acinetobacter sp. ANC 4169 TaxID=1977879 RepID=UPI000A34F6EF|nr:GNAT family N-acetyltransferase [Acinetobacter sp. ANC 4169]OTG77061.1 GNAT family N-acetyltransferase [Acinetobacter sp. ANC 4169]